SLRSQRMAARSTIPISTSQPALPKLSERRRLNCRAQRATRGTRSDSRKLRNPHFVSTQPLRLSHSANPSFPPTPSFACRLSPAPSPLCPFVRLSPAALHHFSSHPIDGPICKLWILYQARR